MRWILSLILFASACQLWGCSSMKVEDFAQQSPRFLMEEYFVGKTKGNGIFFDRSGTARVFFTVDLEGKWDGKVLNLSEVLTYSSGEVLKRDYKITKVSEELYIATTPDIVGEATIKSSGNALNWSYRLKQDIGGSIWTLTFDDWMFLSSDGTVLNRAWASKFGFGVGEVFMSIKKV